MEELEALEHVDEPDAEDRVVAGMDVRHRRGVVAGRSEGEARQLPDRHADDRQQGEDDDLEDGEVRPR